MNRPSNRIGLGAIGPAAWAALQWRLLLLWLLGLALPTAIVALPLWRALAAQLDTTLHVGELARHFDSLAIGDLVPVISKSSSLIGANGLLAMIIVVLMSPLLTGLSVAAIRANRRLGFGELIHGGLSEYGRLFRLLLWAIVPLGAALALGGVAMHVAGKNADAAILASQVDRARYIALFIAALLFVFAHASVEAARAQFAADATLRSAIRAWWRGLKLVLRRPLAMLGTYLIVAAIGLGIAAVLGVWRIGIAHASLGGFLLALLATQLIAMCIGWMRSTRLFAFAEIARRN